MDLASAARAVNAANAASPGAEVEAKGEDEEAMVVAVVVAWRFGISCEGYLHIEN